MRKEVIFNQLCGGGGIRTPGTLPFNSFQDCRHRPLGHTSNIISPERTAKIKIKNCPGKKYLASTLLLRLIGTEKELVLEE